MSRYLVPAAMVSAMIAFAVAALAAGLAPARPGWWQAAVSLAILGGIIPMISAIVIRIVPVFSRRSWAGEAWLRLQVGLAIAGAWTVFAGHITGQHAGVVAGNLLALGGGIMLAVNNARLFRQPASARPAPPLPYPDQAIVDRVATRFMRFAGISLLFGLGVGAVVSIWRPEQGRWDLVWAHAILIGFFLSMASGICYHVLTRWTDRRWRAIAPIQWHFALVAIGLPLMLLALASDQLALLAVAGPLQAAAIALFLANIAPLVAALPQPTRRAVQAAMLLLLVGIVFGAAFAAHPAMGARLRLVHAEINLFGWSGLLISGIGLYFLPRLAGQPLFWPRLTLLQLGALATGVTLCVAGLLWRTYGNGPAWTIAIAQSLVAASFLILALQIAGTVWNRGSGTVATIALAPRPTPRSAPGAGCSLGVSHARD